ncbi:MAG TPA: hypothetical protein ENJ53_05255 [Phaeodactylibacter sp.]|nr:hypothetical protein [Phaeodactylibacter sp.]
MQTKILFICLFLAMSWSLSAQNGAGKTFDFGLEIQQYPTGFLLGGRAELGWSAHHSMSVRVGYNVFDHKDFAIHQSEKGGGFGFTLGYRYYVKASNQKLFFGARTDFWWNSVDWKDHIGLSNEGIGNTKIIVVQPTAIVGYLFLINEHWVVSPTIALGGEINVITKGEPTGQGVIFLWGINLEYRF